MYPLLGGNNIGNVLAYEYDFFCDRYTILWLGKREGSSRAVDRGSQGRSKRDVLPPNESRSCKHLFKLIGTEREWNRREPLLYRELAASPRQTLPRYSAGEGWIPRKPLSTIKAR
ncbi:hypothetical protein HZH66_008811 [Vespula vulgaris]|uniref:Uncharacterized protein n=1 Tax=Vespula vulgaris TaxID=7454 RepID=A0A834JQK0_VESVU|nr:hypothetical protein HZH66_008811 [Vespula vulgaris]